MLDIFNIKNKPHAIIFKANNLYDIDSYIKKYIKSILNKDEKKIDTLEYLDLIWFDNTDVKISKEDVNSLINNFNSSAKEKDGVKFYVIKNIEKCNLQVCNALLKFIEEPHNNIYAIFTCNNIAKVLPTIVSRCQVISINVNETENNEIKAKLNLSDNDYEIINKIYLDFNELKNDIDSGLINSSITFVNNTLLLKKNDLSSYKTQLELFKKLSNKEMELILKIIFVITKSEKISEYIDMVKLNPIKPLLFDQIVNTLLK